MFIKASTLQWQEAYIRVRKSIINASKPLLWVLVLNVMTHNTGGALPLLCVTCCDASGGGTAAYS